MRAMLGSEIPLCYGFYDFRLPCGDFVRGVVLEYVTEIARLLKSHVRRPEVRKALNLQTVDALVSSSFAPSNLVADALLFHRRLLLSELSGGCTTLSEHSSTACSGRTTSSSSRIPLSRPPNSSSSTLPTRAPATPSSRGKKTQWEQVKRATPHMANDEYDLLGRDGRWRIMDVEQVTGAFEEVIPTRLWEKWDQMERGRDALGLYAMEWTR